MQIPLSSELFSGGVARIYTFRLRLMSAIHHVVIARREKAQDSLAHVREGSLGEDRTRCVIRKGRMQKLGKGQGADKVCSCMISGQGMALDPKRDGNMHGSVTLRRVTAGLSSAEQHQCRLTFFVDM